LYCYPGHSNSAEDIQAEEVKPQQQQEQIDLFRFINPRITEDEDRLRVHREVCNTVRNLPMSEICKHLMLMKKEEKIYITVKPELMYAELVRLGMPDEDKKGYSYKNFTHHFNIK
jgi:hypothetical protein